MLSLLSHFSVVRRVCWQKYLKRFTVTFRNLIKRRFCPSFIHGRVFKSHFQLVDKKIIALKANSFNQLCYVHNYRLAHPFSLSKCPWLNQGKGSRNQKMQNYSRQTLTSQNMVHEPLFQSKIRQGRFNPSHPVRKTTVCIIMLFYWAWASSSM